MSKVFKKRDIKSALERKGFVKGKGKITELKDFIECPLSKDEYVKILKDKNRYGERRGV